MASTSVQLHLALTAAAVVRNHNQNQCCTLLFVSEARTCGAVAAPPLVTYRIAPQHLRCLPGWEGTRATAPCCRYLCTADVLPTLLHLDTQGPACHTCAPVPLLMHVLHTVALQPRCHLRTSPPALVHVNHTHA